MVPHLALGKISLFASLIAEVARAWGKGEPGGEGQYLILLLKWISGKMKKLATF